jgi:uncharacterized protein YkwD
VSRCIGASVSIVVFALLASSAAASPLTDAAPIPSKRELQLAGASLADKGRASLNLAAVAGRMPKARKLVAPKRSRSATNSSRPDAARRSAVALESSLLARVNAVRGWHGLQGLRLSPGLSAAAAFHSRQMVQHGFFQHESRGGGSFWKRVKRFYGSTGFRSWEVGENLAFGSPDLDAVATVRMWMNSPGHRDNLLARHWREAGLDALHVESAGGEFGGSPVTVITLDFGLRVR